MTLRFHIVMSRRTRVFSGRGTRPTVSRVSYTYWLVRLQPLSLVLPCRVWTRPENTYTSTSSILNLYRHPSFLLRLSDESRTEGPSTYHVLLIGRKLSVSVLRSPHESFFGLEIVPFLYLSCWSLHELSPLNVQMLPYTQRLLSQCLFC